MEGHPPPDNLPAVQCDLNAQGWAGNGDTSFYALSQEPLAALNPVSGQKVFLWDEDDEDTVLGWVAVLEPCNFPHGPSWRAIPVPGTFYRGPKPAAVLRWLGA